MSRDYLGIFRNSSIEQERDKVDKKIEDISKKSVFETALVIDFVSNPNEFLELETIFSESDISKRSKVKGTSSLSGNKIKNKDLYREGMRVNNTSFLDIMPQNSIIGYTISQKNPELTVLFPFFPSHFSPPVKPGERVWFFYDYTGGVKIGYWLHRKIGTKYTEDVNYTDEIRQTIISYLGAGIATDKSSEEEYKKAIHSFLSGLSPEKGYDDTKNLDINRIHSHATAYKNFKGAVTPPSYKKCSDFILQGSNNSKIIMTNTENNNTGEVRIIAGYNRDLDHPKIKNNRPLDLVNMEYEEYDKLSEGSPMLKNNLGSAEKIIPQSYSVPGSDTSGLSNVMGKDTNTKSYLPEPANICIKEHQASFQSMSNLEYYERKGTEKPSSSEEFTGNIVLKTRSNGDLLDKKEAVIDLLGPDLKITNTSKCHFHIRDDGNISLSTATNSTSKSYVIIGSEDISDSEPIVLGDKLFDFLNTLLNTLANSTVVTPAGTSSPLVTLVPDLLPGGTLFNKLNTIRSDRGRIK